MRVLIFFALILVATPTRAGWYKAAEGSDWDTYVDPSTLKVSGDIRRQWILRDRKHRGKFGELSLREYVEVDCKEVRIRVLTTTMHYEHMAVGETIRTWTQPGDWAFMPPDSYGYTLVRLICSQ